MLRLGLILMAICLAAALVLAGTYKLTAPKIEAQKTSQERQALKGLLPTASEFVEKEQQRQEIPAVVYYEGVKDNNLVGYVLKIKAKGYGGDIDMLVGIDPSGIIQGVEILSQQETPGLGSRITEIKQGEKRPWFLEQFKAKTAKYLDMSGIQAISGATISSAAVLEAVKKEVYGFIDQLADKEK
jgi:electron transport complex protein RnfG